MPAIYERIAVCSDTTWNALDAAEQAGYDLHYNTWTGFLGAPKSDLVAINSGCREVIVWDEFGVLPRFDVTSSQIGRHNADNYTIIRAHETARNNGSVTTGLKMDGANHNYTVTHVVFDGIIFDEGTDGTSGNNYYLSFGSNWFSFENCVFANLYYCMYNMLTTGYFKNCLFYNWNIYYRKPSAGTLFYNCGFYNTFSHTYTYALGGGEYYNCWGFEATSAKMFHRDCTGDNNYASDGSGPISERTLSSFGFTDPANGDFSITSASPLYDRGVTTGNETSIDIAGNPRNAGAALDIGPFEVVVQTRLTLNGVVIGSAVSVVDLDNGGFIVAPFVADETTEVMEFSLAVNTNVSVRVRNASGTTKYLPWKSDFLLTPSGATLYVNQLEDNIA